ncbi:uncharacterized protein LACBIDRAFT_332874 [Laccaria bicolor S238N-H82]|uniref:Predicted protein n=1 Tax=Laccaria bicolor (strain S238N-H82 / ATCC MYA-4686) TaxID=486041 RepID=B0DU46_LACBS|nr:uncharacterized protein LACBIDRAFT_332874 [Laccaria bicolor S238N-H82]EDR01884.1 predicted protein [Laccaria bicolor S238N-H82]|eukprot:XP_001887494.1 predicted protein [Laccaria bicolor S238N-H82]
MGDAYSDNTMNVLHGGIQMLYPSIDSDMDPEGRFFITHGHDTDEYVIYDEEFSDSNPLRIDKSILTNTHFDLAKWYHTRHYPKIPLNMDDIDLDTSLFENLNKNDELWLDHSDESDSEDGLPDLQSVFDLDWDDENESLPNHRSDSDSDDGLPDLQSVSDSNWDNENESLPSLESLNSSLPSLESLNSSVTDMESDWDERIYTPMDDVLGEAIEQILEASAPYPGDANILQNPNNCFDAERVEDGRY